MTVSRWTMAVLAALLVTPAAAKPRCTITLMDRAPDQAAVTISGMPNIELDDFDFGHFWKRKNLAARIDGDDCRGVVLRSQAKPRR